MEGSLFTNSIGRQWALCGQQPAYLAAADTPERPAPYNLARPCIGNTCNPLISPLPVCPLRTPARKSNGLCGPARNRPAPRKGSIIRAPHLPAPEAKPAPKQSAFGLTSPRRTDQCRMRQPKTFTYENDRPVCGCLAKSPNFLPSQGNQLAAGSTRKLVCTNDPTPLRGNWNRM